MVTGEGRVTCVGGISTASVSLAESRVYRSVVSQRSLNLVEQFGLGQLLIVGVERIASTGQAIAWSGGAIAECTADALSSERAAGQRVGRKLGIGQNHPPQPDEIDPAGADDR